MTVPPPKNQFNVVPLASARRARAAAPSAESEVALINRRALAAMRFAREFGVAAPNQRAALAPQRTGPVLRAGAIFAAAVAIASVIWVAG